MGLAMDRTDALAAELAAAARRSRRYLLGITGVGGAGKSTLAADLARRIAGACVVPMDGFHLPNAELDRLGIRDRKGAPHTFDAEAFVAMVERLAAAPATTVAAPRYDRAIHEPVADAIVVPAAAPLVIVEGNYLLLHSPPWNRLPTLLDAVWFVDTPIETAMARLRRRHLAGGCTAEQADRKIAGNDRPNADLIRATRGRADRVVGL